MVAVIPLATLLGLSVPSGAAQTQGSSPLPPSLEAVLAVAAKVRLSPGRGAVPAWRLSEASWSMVWSLDAFGVTGLAGDASAFRFRVPPDAGVPRTDGKPPYSAESYRSGLPLLAVRGTIGGEPARPLGFRYGRDDLCTNVSIQVMRGGRWRRARLTRLEFRRLRDAIREWIPRIEPEAKDDMNP